MIPNGPGACLPVSFCPAISHHFPQLASHFTVSRSAISQHLGVLADSGLVTSRRAGKFQYYRLNARGMAALRAELDSFWTRELDQLVRDARALP